MTALSADTRSTLALPQLTTCLHKQSGLRIGAGLTIGSLTYSRVRHRFVYHRHVRLHRIIRLSVAALSYLIHLSLATTGQATPLLSSPVSGYVRNARRWLRLSVFCRLLSGHCPCDWSATACSKVYVHRPNEETAVARIIRPAKDSPGSAMFFYIVGSSGAYTMMVCTVGITGACALERLQFQKEAGLQLNTITLACILALLLFARAP